MSKQLAIDDARRSLGAHLAAKGAEICQRYGPQLGWNELQEVLDDRTCVRYPCKILFEAEPLLPGEFAHPLANGPRPEDGFTIYVHPFFQTQLARVPYLVLYQLVVVNYGDFASADDAETFGSEALGLGKEEYYSALCELADAIDNGKKCQ